MSATARIRRHAARVGCGELRQAKIEHLDLALGRDCHVRCRRDAPARAAGSSGRTYDVSPDGLRFLMIKAPGTDASTAPPALIIVQHWDEELKRLVPAK